jgi:hypothetical protein
MALIKPISVQFYRCLLILYVWCCLSGCAWQIVEQSEIQLNLLAEASTFSSTPLPSVPIMPPILTEFEQLQEEALKSNSSSSQAASVCANGVCTIY